MTAVRTTSCVLHVICRHECTVGAQRGDRVSNMNVLLAHRVVVVSNMSVLLVHRVVVVT